MVLADTVFDFEGVEQGQLSGPTDTPRVATRSVPAASRASQAVTEMEDALFSGNERRFSTSNVIGRTPPDGAPRPVIRTSGLIRWKGSVFVLLSERVSPTNVEELPAICARRK